MNPNDFIQRLQQSIYGQPQGADEQARPLDVANAQIKPIGNSSELGGVWGVLSKVAQMRGQAHLAQLFGAKDEQTRQMDLKGKQVGQDYTKALTGNLAADNERADYDAQVKATMDRAKLLEQGNGTEPAGVDINYVEQLPASGGKWLPPPNNPPGPPSTVKMQNPELEMPGFKGSPSTKFRPPTAPELSQRSTAAKILEEMYKGVNIPDGGMYKNFGLGISVENPKAPTEKVLTEWQSKLNIIQGAHPDWSPEKVMQEAVNLTKDPLTHELLAQRLEDQKKKAEDEKADEDYYSGALLPDETTGEPKVYLNQLRNILPHYTSGALANIVVAADKKSGGKFNMSNSWLQGDAAEKNIGNLMRADFAAKNAEANYKRMLEDIRDINAASKSPMGKDIGAMDMDLLARHLSLTTGSVANARVGRDIIEEHKKARGLPENVRVAYEYLVSHPGAQLSPQQRKNFLELGKNAYDNAVQQLNDFRKPPAIQGGTR